jgi:hypothetical protein
MRTRQEEIDLGIRFIQAGIKTYRHKHFYNLARFLGLKPGGGRCLMDLQNLIFNYGSEYPVPDSVEAHELIFAKMLSKRDVSRCLPNI